LARRTLTLVAILLVAVLALIIIKFTKKEYSLEDVTKEAKVVFDLRSPAYSDNGVIPKKYTCDGLNIPPPLEWRNVPRGTKTFVIIMFDPDAPGGTFIHWVLFNIPGNLRNLTKEVGVRGLNDFGKLGYGGPCPPKGSTHRYIIRIFAIDIELNLKEGAKLENVLNAMKGHVLGYAELTGKYGR